MKKIIWICILFFSFILSTFAVDIFIETSSKNITLEDTLYVNVKILNNEDISSWKLEILWIENFSEISRSQQLSFVSINGASSYSLEINMQLLPLREWNFSLQAQYFYNQEIFESSSMDVFVSWKSNIFWNEIEPSKKNIFSQKQIIFILLFLWGVIVFIFQYKNQKNKHMQKNNSSHEISENITSETFENINTIDDFKKIFLDYAKNKFWISKKSSQTWQEFWNILLEKIPDSEEQNTIQSIIKIIQSSEYSVQEIDNEKFIHIITQLLKLIDTKQK